MASNTNDSVCTSTILPPSSIEPARAIKSPGDTMWFDGSDMSAGKVCMPQTIPVSSKARNTLSSVLVSVPLVGPGKIWFG